MRKALLLSVILIFSVGCASSFLHQVEQTQALALETTNAFVTLEYENRQALASVVPEAKVIADQIRKQGPPAFRALDAAVDAYRMNRTPEGKADVATWLAVVGELARQAGIVLAQWKGSGA